MDIKEGFLYHFRYAGGSNPGDMRFILSQDDISKTGPYANLIGVNSDDELRQFTKNKISELKTYKVKYVNKNEAGDNAKYLKVNQVFGDYYLILESQIVDDSIKLKDIPNQTVFTFNDNKTKAVKMNEYVFKIDSAKTVSMYWTNPDTIFNNYKPLGLLKDLV